MGFNFDAIIGKKPIKEDQAKVMGLPIIYEAGYAIIPLIDLNVEHYSLDRDIDDEYFGDEIQFDYTSVHCMAKDLGLTDYVLARLSYDYFWGTYYKNGVKELHEVHINDALRALGACNHNNEPFEYLNLNNYRQSEFYYWSDEFTKPDHIIKGKELVPDYSKS